MKRAMEKTLQLLFVVVLILPGFCRQANVRLVGGSTKKEGRVEIFYNGSWGTVCDDRWDRKDAKVVCRSLGLPKSVAALGKAAFGPGAGPIWMTSVRCRGNETSLFQCPHEGPGSPNCGHGRDASVVCERLPLRNFTGVISSPGYPKKMPRAYYDWTFIPPIRRARIAFYIEDLDLFGKNWLGKVSLKLRYGSNTRFLDVPHYEPKPVSPFVATIPAKVTYFSASNAKARGFKMRYYAFSMSEKNQVVNKKWKFSVIKNNPGTFRVSWSRIPSRHPGSKYTYLVICKRVKSTRIKIARAMNSRSAVIDILQPKTKYSIRVIAFDTSRANRKPIYSHPQLVKTLDGKIRLVGWSKKATNTAGRVEIFYKGHWRKICYTVGFWSSWRSWDLNNANVVCRSLGLPRAVAAPHSVVFGIGTSPTWIKKVHCRGTETSLFQCRRNTVWRGRKCHKDNYASVVCFVPPVYLNVTTLAGVISSPGYPRYMKQARYEWTFVLPVIPRARMALYFESIDLSGHQYLGNSNVTLQDLSGHQLFHLSNTKSEPLFLIQNKTTKLVYYSWFTRRGKGLRVRYLFYRPFDEALLQNASILASSTSPHSISVSIGSFTVDGFKVLGYFITCNSTDDWHRTASYAIADNKTKTASCHRLVGLANYKVQVFAVGTNATDGSMMMYKSNPNEIKTLEEVPSQSPSGFHVVSSTSSTIHVQWNPLPRDHANGILLGYKVEYYDTFHLRRSKTITTNNTQVVLEHDLPGMVYRITVRGFTGKGQGPFSTTELYTKCGGIEQQAQGTMSHPPYNYRSWSLNCWWTLKAPSKMGMIVISLYVYSEDCGLFNNADEMVHRLCKTRREIFFAYISFGTANLQSYTARLVFLGSSFVMKAKYYMFENGLDDVPFEPTWYIIAKIDRLSINVQWSECPLSSNTTASTKVMSYVAVCIAVKNHTDISVARTDGQGRSVSVTHLGKYTEYYVQVVAVLGTSSTWRSAREIALQRSRNITMRTMGKGTDD